jgi:dipeptidyl aminopeptidase/acylaminoacyl peptidase
MFDANGQRTRITELNPQLARFRFSKPELFNFHNADGERLGALLYRPAGIDPDGKVPVITWVYEKMTPAIHRFDARDQMFISHGYAMLMPNVKVKVGRTADSFEKCVVPAVNAVRAMGFTTGRFALWGHSFGAYATSNLITRTDIFAAAVSGATPPELFRNWASGRDRDSRNIETGQARMGGSPFEFPDRYFSQSAFFHLDRVSTPVLILHGEKDLTILFGEGEMMFYALRQLGKTAEFVSYANGDHSLSRHSRADALDVNRRILEWFDRYLKRADAGKTE